MEYRRKMLDGRMDFQDRLWTKEDAATLRKYSHVLVSMVAGMLYRVIAVLGRTMGRSPLNHQPEGRDPSRAYRTLRATDKRGRT